MYLLPTNTCIFLCLPPFFLTIKGLVSAGTLLLDFLGFFMTDPAKYFTVPHVSEQW